MADARHRGVVVDLVGEVLHRKGSVHFTVTSSSMEPALRVGDRAEVERLPAGGPGLGEIVLFQDPTLGHVLHRVLWRWPLLGRARSVFTKGDAAAYRDPTLPAERVLGRVVRIFRGRRALGRRSRLQGLGRSALGMVRHRLGAGADTAEVGHPGPAEEKPPERRAEMIDSLHRQP